MIQLGTFSLFIGIVAGHFGLKAVIVDGTTYPPFDSRIDNLLPGVRRIEWSHDVAAMPMSPVFDPMSQAIACQNNPKVPALKAPVRAGADIKIQWTEIIKMHFGPTLAYMAEFPTPDTKPTEAKFFKIYEKGYDRQKGKWANEIASDNGDSYMIQIPSDIKSGTYILRTEIIALHGNANMISSTPLAGPQFYTYCFNIDVVNGGTAQPEGVKFPGAYTKQALSAPIYLPFAGDSAATQAKGKETNSNYVLPGPPLYKGTFDAPKGSPPVVNETGAYTGELQAKYEAMAKKLAVPTQDLVKYVNTAVFENGKMSAPGIAGFPSVVGKVVGERNKIIKTPEFEDLKALVAKARA